MSPKRLHGKRIAARTALLARLRANGRRFTGKQAVLADFVRENLYKAAFMTVSELAAEVKTSPATVVRFAGALGYRGYPGLKRHLHQVVQEDLGGPELFALHLARRGADPLRLLVGAEIENLSSLLHDVSMADLNRAADMISAAARVFVAGFRAESGLAHYFGYHLSKIHPDVHILSNHTDWPLDRMNLAAPADILVAICFPRYARMTVEVVEFARQIGLSVIAVTDASLSPLSKRSTLAFHVRGAVASFVDSLCACQVLLGSILAQISVRDRKRTAFYLKRFEAMAKRRAVFYSESG